MAFFQPIDKSFCLEQLCESNYRKLFLLCPDLLAFSDNTVGWSAQNSSLHLTVLARSPYTLTIELSHAFADESAAPSVQICLYLDAKLAEALSDYARVRVFDVYPNPRASRDIMDYKWRLNIFLHKWLETCVEKNVHFHKIPSCANAPSLTR
jgi:uncharacterized protein YqiB (DUF1249 family)